MSSLAAWKREAGNTATSTTMTNWSRQSSPARIFAPRTKARPICLRIPVLPMMPLPSSPLAARTLAAGMSSARGRSLGTRKVGHWPSDGARARNCPRSRLMTGSMDTAKRGSPHGITGYPGAPGARPPRPARPRIP